MSLSQQQPNISSSEVADDDCLRSQYMRRLIVKPADGLRSSGHASLPRLLVQFWDDASAIPTDVQECLDSWAPLEAAGFERRLFDDSSGAEFIAAHFESRHLLAFKRCMHPAMRADYLRLCFMREVGGLYVDADDVYQGFNLDGLFSDSLLKLHPLCYDIETDSMVEPMQATHLDGAEKRIYYVNNNPLISPPGHPVIANALERATLAVLDSDGTDRDVQSLTGPGNLTACLVAHAFEQDRLGDSRDFELLTNWDEVAISKWPLSYRSDDRNWRRWASHEGQAS